MESSPTTTTFKAANYSRNGDGICSKPYSEASFGLWDFMFGPLPPPSLPPPCATTSATDSAGNTTGTSGCQ